jgi:hypothetical protein
MNSKNTICLWYDGTALDAAKFYAETFPDSAVEAVHLAPGDYPAGKQGGVLTVEFRLMGMSCLGLNGGRHSATAKPSRSRWRPTIRWKQTAFGTRSSATVDGKAPAAGARTNGDCRGRSRHAP